MKIYWKDHSDSFVYWVCVAHLCRVVLFTHLWCSFEQLFRCENNSVFYTHWSLTLSSVLAVLGLSCFMQTLSLQHVRSSFLTRGRTWAPCIGSAVLATGPPKKSPNTLLRVNKVNVVEKKYWSSFLCCLVDIWERKEKWGKEWWYWSAFLANTLFLCYIYNRGYLLR